MPPKLKELLADLTGQLKNDPADRDESALTATLGALEAYGASDEAKGYVGTDKLSEWADQLAQLRKDVDAQAEESRRLAQLGLRREGGAVRLAGKREVLDLMALGRVFPTDRKAAEFGALAVRSIMGPLTVYKEIVPQRTREMAASLVKDLDPGVSTAGAELVAAVYMADLIAPLEAVGVLYPQCDRVPLATTGQTTWPKLTGELTAYPLAASAQFTESAPTFGTVTMTPVKWGTLTPIPIEFFRNPTLLAPLGQLIGTLIVRAIGYAFDNALVNGDGTADYGTITGILQSDNITAVTAADTHTTMATYDGTDVSNVIAGLAVDYVQDPAFHMSLSVERKLRALKDSNGNPLYLRGNNGEPNTIDGYPYAICQRFTASGSVSAGTKFGAFGDLRLSHFFGMLNAIEIAASEHCRFEQGVVVVRGMAFADAAEKDANAIVTMKTAAS